RSRVASHPRRGGHLFYLDPRRMRAMYAIHQIGRCRGSILWPHMRPVFRSARALPQPWLDRTHSHLVYNMKCRLPSPVASRSAREHAAGGPAAYLVICLWWIVARGGYRGERSHAIMIYCRRERYMAARRDARRSTTVVAHRGVRMRVARHCKL